MFAPFYKFKTASAHKSANPVSHDHETALPRPQLVDAKRLLHQFYVEHNGWDNARAFKRFLHPQFVLHLETAPVSRRNSANANIDEETNTSPSNVDAHGSGRQLDLAQALKEMDLSAQSQTVCRRYVVDNIEKIDNQLVVQYTLYEQNLQSETMRPVARRLAIWTIAHHLFFGCYEYTLPDSASVDMEHSHTPAHL